MMKPESLIQLIGSGNATTVENTWMSVMESPDMTPPQLADYQVVLRALCEKGQSSQAATLAWTAIETIAARCTPHESLTVAKPFLLAVGEGDDLRVQVVDLYRSAYADLEGLEALLTESGLGGGRPVRRAIRTLDVCLTLKEGDYLAGRDEEAAAQVSQIDRADWLFTITVGSACRPQNGGRP